VPDPIGRRLIFSGGSEEPLEAEVADLRPKGRPGSRTSPSGSARAPRVAHVSRWSDCSRVPHGHAPRAHVERSRAGRHVTCTSSASPPPRRTPGPESLAKGSRRGRVFLGLAGERPPERLALQPPPQHPLSRRSRALSLRLLS
jgi:hypothetical protein